MSAIFVGLMLILGGYLWPIVGSVQWSDQQAQEFAEASAAQIKQAHERFYESRDHDETRAEVLSTQRRFDRIKAELETARRRPSEIAFWLKTVGCALAAIGLLTLLARRNSH